MEHSEKAPEALPPPPPVIPPNVVPIRFKSADNVPEETRRISKQKLSPMARQGFGSRGRTIQLLANHFQVAVTKPDGYFYQYSVSLTNGDGRPVNHNSIGRKLIDKVRETYHPDLGRKDLAYDGAMSLFTVGPLPRKRMDFTVVLEDCSATRTAGDDDDSPHDHDRKRMRRAFQSKKFEVNINFAAKIPINYITSALRGRESEKSQEALRVLDIILRQHAAKQGCLLVRQSFFHNDPRSCVDLGGGVLGCRGFHSSFRITQAGLSLNMDGTTTTTIKPGPLVDFLIDNQNVSNCYQIIWPKAKRTLKNLMIKVSSTNQEHKITGISENRCKDQMFSMKTRNDRNEVETVDITVYEYYRDHRHIDLSYSADLPCINVGKPRRPIYFPVELCTLLPLQRYTKAPSVLQRAKLVEKSRQKPQEKMNILTHAMRKNDYAAEPMLQSCGITICSQFTKVEGRVLPAPRLHVGNGEGFIPRNGRWNFSNKRFFEPAKIENWAVVNFSARCDNVRGLCRELRHFAEMRGIFISSPAVDVIEENQQVRRLPPPVRVERMFEQVKKAFPRGPPSFLLCLLAEKNSDLYGPWKRKALSEFGIFTQCLVPGNRAFNEQYMTNVLLKINAKLGGFNSFLPIENIHLVSKIPTIIFGMDVCHGNPGQADVPSIGAVVSTRNWPLLSCYRASVRSQSPKVELIDALYEPVGKDTDTGIIRELLKDFYINSGSRKPAHIIVFRDGVSESQFNQILNIELDQMIKACQHLDGNWSPKFTIIIAQKNHHTKFFRAQSSQDNVPPGTVIDNGICHPHNNDFYMCAHAGPIGTTRPTHYNVLLDEIGFSADDIQELVHTLSYAFQRSTTAISIVAPVRYAHLAAAQSFQWLKFQDTSSKASSSQGSGASSSRKPPVPELPVLHDKVSGSMFFC